MQDNHVREPDHPKREILIPSQNDEHTEHDETMKKVFENSMETYEKEYIMQCQDHVLEHEIQMLLQKEYDLKEKERMLRDEKLRELMIRLKIIDKERIYMDIV